MGLDEDTIIIYTLHDLNQTSPKYIFFCRVKHVLVQKVCSGKRLGLKPSIVASETWGWG